MNENILSVKTTAKDFFLYLSVTVCLYITSISFINLLFGIIDKVFPDPLNRFYYDAYQGGVRFAMAALFVILPLFLALYKFLEKSYENEPSKKNIWVRKWISYLTLFLAGGVIAGSLVATIFSFLNGEITTRFILKVFAIAFTTALIFTYYLLELKDKLTPPSKRVWAILIAVLIIASLVTGFVVFGSPMKARKLRFDEQKISDLQNIQWRIVNYWQMKNTLPLALMDLKDPLVDNFLINDPETGDEYEYKVLSGNQRSSFKLCATFNYKSQNIQGSPMPKSAPITPDSVSNDTWFHNAGKTCFDRSIDPELYKKPNY